MAKLQNKLIAKFEVIEGKVEELGVLVQNCTKAITIAMDHSNVLFEGLIRSSDQENFYLGPCQVLDHINNVFALIIERVGAGHLVGSHDQARQFQSKSNCFLP